MWILHWEYMVQRQTDFFWVEKVRNDERVAKGVLDHSWTDIVLIAQLSGKNEQEVKETWEKIAQG